MTASDIERVIRAFERPPKPAETFPAKGQTAFRE
jgi:hypothetical protein